MKGDESYIKTLAKDYQWYFLDHQRDIGLISFGKVSNGYRSRINIYLTTMTVGTCIDHPKQGKTQLFRKHVDYPLLRKIFQNPRIHTGKGYKRK